MVFDCVLFSKTDFCKQPRLLRNKGFAFDPNPSIFWQIRPSRLDDYVAYKSARRTGRCLRFVDNRTTERFTTHEVQGGHDNWAVMKAHQEKKSRKKTHQQEQQDSPKKRKDIKQKENRKMAAKNTRMGHGLPNRRKDDEQRRTSKQTISNSRAEN